MSDVTTKHPQYEEYREQWEEMRDHLKGSRRIKSKGQTYLPMLGDPTDQEDVRDYQAYLGRALYYEATKRTHQAMVGAILMKPPQYINLPDKYLPYLGNVTLEGFSSETFVRNVVSEVVATSRAGVLVERASGPEVDQQYFVQYNAEDVINWRFERVGNEIQLTLVVLHETYVENIDRFDNEERNRFRVLELIDGIYTQTVFEELVTTTDGRTAVDYVEQPPVVPTRRGEPLDFIPFVFFTPLGNVAEMCEPILSGIAEINLSHYRSSADLEHGRHFTGLPTAWVAGFDTETRLKVGSQVAWVSSDPAARAGFLEFTGSGLNSLVIALAEKQEQMATLGARMLRAPRTGVEAAETARIYQSAESGSLSSLANAMSESFTALMGYWLWWMGDDSSDDVAVELNTDYVDTRLDAQGVTALLNLWISGAISYETLFYNLKQGEIMPDGADMETERDLISVQGPVTNERPAGE